MQKRTMLILHGWGLSSFRFAPLVMELKKRGYTVYAPDLPGFGDQPPPNQPLKLQDYVAYLNTYCIQNKIELPIIIGHSFGGRVALKYQEMYPKNVRVLILTGTPGYRSSKRKKMSLAKYIAKIGRNIFSLPLLVRYQEKVREKFYYAIGVRDYSRAKGVMRQTFKHVVGEELVEPMQAVSMPCLLLWGEQDILVPVSIALRMKQVIPQAQLTVLPDASHAVPYEEPVKFSDAMEQFLKQI